MSEFVPTDSAIEAIVERYTWGDPGEYIGKDWAKRSLAAAFAHPDFQRQLRAYVAEQMRGLVPAEQGHEGKPYGEAVHIRAKNEARAETLANIERWENDNG